HCLFQENKTDAPLVLWLQGGPGKSALYGQYLEVGPVGIDANERLYARNNTIQKEANIIFLDQPTGAGLSILPNYTNPSYYAQMLTDMAVLIEEFLRQFVILFAEYKGRKFYVAGESYGARAAVGLAERLRCGYVINETILPLSGVILGSGFLAPLLDLIDSSDFLYNVRLLDEIGRQTFSQQFELIKTFVAPGNRTNYTVALYLLATTVLNLRIDGRRSLFQNLTGFTDHGNAIKPLRPPEADAYVKFVNTSKFKSDLHVPQGVKLDALRPMVATVLGMGDYFVSVEEVFKNVLENLNVLLYTAQLDAVFPSVNFDRYFRNMSWSRKAAFNKASKKSWSSCEKIPRLLGYVTKVGSLTYATVLKAGHHTARDEPYSVYDIMSRFIRDTNFAENLQCSNVSREETQ
ncbi:unnamed protein product, partial [Ixodes hexagonus]